MGSANNEVIEINNAYTSKAGFHLLFSVSRQMCPFTYTFGWNTLAVKNRTLGGVIGYDGENCNYSRNRPPSHGELPGPLIMACQRNKLSFTGWADMPNGACPLYVSAFSVYCLDTDFCNECKSRIKRRYAWFVFLLTLAHIEISLVCCCVVACTAGVLLLSLLLIIILLLVWAPLLLPLILFCYPLSSKLLWIAASPSASFVFCALCSTPR